MPQQNSMKGLRLLSDQLYSVLLATWFYVEALPMSARLSNDILYFDRASMSFVFLINKELLDVRTKAELRILRQRLTARLH